MNARDIMTKDVLSIKSSVMIGEAIKILVENKISGLVVVDDNDDIVGIVSEKDLLVAYDFLNRTKEQISDFISRDVVSVTEDTDVFDVSRLLIQKNIKRVPVVNGKKVVGVVSRKDILQHILDDIEQN